MRDKQALILDTLLEVIENMREFKRNLENNPYLYNFDYKEELKNLVRTRDRIYKVRDM